MSEHGKFLLDEQGYPAFEKEKLIAINNKYWCNGEILGSGASGRIVAAWSAPNGGEPLAIKIYRKTYLTTALLEATVIDKLLTTPESGLFVKFIDNFMIQELPCLVFPRFYMDLRAFMRKEYSTQHFSMHQIRSIAHQLARAINCMHANSIVHGDIKPSNILLVEDPRTVPEPHIRLIDFGLSAHLQSDRALRGIAQTWPYRAPEIYLEFDWDDKCDVWAYGCVLFELYTKRQLLLDKGFELESMERLFGEEFSQDIRYADRNYQPKLPLNFEQFDSLRTNYKSIELFRRGDTTDEEQLFTLLKKMFRIWTHQRISMDEVLRDDFFKQDTAT